MKPEQQRIAIAEACGYKPGCKCRLKQPRWRTPDDSGCCSINELPNYLNDLNALHEAEKILTEEQQTVYYDTVIDTFAKHKGKFNDTKCFFISATAVQRAEAFLKAIGKWIED